MIQQLVISGFRRLAKPFVLGSLWLFFTYVVVALYFFELGEEVKLKPVEIAAIAEELLVVQTGFYYNTSVFYSGNTAVLIYHADHRQNSTDWVCITHNETDSLNSDALVRRATNNSQHCYWMTHFVICPTVVNPTKFELSVVNATSKIEIPLELPDRKPRGIVACYAPMFFEQRWESIAMTHELNAAWGVDLQVHYVQSVVGDLMKLLQPMVDLGLLEFRGLDIPNFGKALDRKLGYNPAQATEARHQVVALQDCYFRYRESAEFIMVSDPDDLFLPLHGRSIYDEFSYWKNIHPTASAFMFDRRNTYVKTATTIKDYNITENVNSMKLTDLYDIAGKSVFNPRFTETPWIHWPSINATPFVHIPRNESYLAHLSYFFDNKTPFPRGPTTNLSEIVDMSSLANLTIVNYDEERKKNHDIPHPTLGYSYLVKLFNMVTAMYPVIDVEMKGGMQRRLMPEDTEKKPSSLKPICAIFLFILGCIAFITLITFMVIGTHQAVYYFTPKGTMPRTNLMPEECYAQMPFNVLKKTFDVEKLMTLSKDRHIPEISEDLRRCAGELAKTVEVLVSKLNEEFNNRQDYFVIDPIIVFAGLTIFVFILDVFTACCLNRACMNVKLGFSLPIWIKAYCRVFYLIGLIRSVQVYLTDCAVYY
uniref:Glycosyltransferase family 92 protein n=1 Tax=Panagrellus redivivus TaxID=6233 RepID=A0A7E4W757_PANRE